MKLLPPQTSGLVSFEELRNIAAAGHKSLSSSPNERNAQFSSVGAKTANSNFKCLATNEAAPFAAFPVFSALAATAAAVLLVLLVLLRQQEFKCKMYLHTSFSWKTFGTDLHTEQEAQTSD